MAHLSGGHFSLSPHRTGRDLLHVSRGLQAIGAMSSFGLRPGDVFGDCSGLLLSSLRPSVCTFCTRDTTTLYLVCT
jgi:hypothetical protein